MFADLVAKVAPYLWQALVLVILVGCAFGIGYTKGAAHAQVACAKQEAEFQAAQTKAAADAVRKRNDIVKHVMTLKPTELDKELAPWFRD